jgi:hypothetical protein
MNARSCKDWAAISSRATCWPDRCPAGTFWWGPFLRYRIVKDLACLDKVAKYHLSRTQRLRFYLNMI